MKGISKEFPWPGSRCGWVEYYNKDKDPDFARLCGTLDDAKMIEVCSTKLPQLAIPRIMGDPRYQPYRDAENQKIGRRSKLISELLGDVPAIKFNETFGAFYNTIIFQEGVLQNEQQMEIKNPEIQKLLDSWLQTPGLAPDQRFVYNLLAAKGVCVVPVSSFCSELQGFRVTLLEQDETILKETFTRIREGILEYVKS